MPEKGLISAKCFLRSFIAIPQVHSTRPPQSLLETNLCSLLISFACRLLSPVLLLLSGNERRVSLISRLICALVRSPQDNNAAAASPSLNQCMGSPLLCRVLVRDIRCCRCCYQRLGYRPAKTPCHLHF